MRYVIMIGNGFDIGLGLRTAYSDFIDEYTNSPAINSERSDGRERVEDILKAHIRRDPRRGQTLKRLSRNCDFLRCLKIVKT